MADWIYAPRCRYDSQGAPQSPFQDGTPVGTSDHGFAWGSQSILSVPTETPNLTLAVLDQAGYVLDDTEGLLLDDIGGIFPDSPWPGGTIVTIEFNQAQNYPPTAGTFYFSYFLRRRSDGTTFTLVTFDAGGQHNGVGYPTYALNPFTAAPWVASEIMGSSAAYDAYTVIDGYVSGNLEFIRFDGGPIITFTPLSGSVISVSPSVGSVAGGQAVTITGTGFTGATVVEFGGIAATGVVVVNDALITAVTPAHESGVVDVEVIGVGTLTDGYLYAIPQLKLPPLPSRTPIMQGTQQGTARRRG